MWEWCSYSPVGAGARAEVLQRELWQERNPATARTQTGRLGAHAEGGSVCVQTSGSLSSLASLPPTHAYHWPSSTRRQRAGESQGCSLYWSASWAWSRAEKGGELTSGRIQRIFSKGAYSNLPSVSVSRGRTVLTDPKNRGMWTMEESLEFCP